MRQVLIVRMKSQDSEQPTEPVRDCRNRFSHLPEIPMLLQPLRIGVEFTFREVLVLRTAGGGYK